MQHPVIAAARQQLMSLWYSFSPVFLTDDLDEVGLQKFFDDVSWVLNSPELQRVIPLEVLNHLKYPGVLPRTQPPVLQNVNFQKEIRGALVEFFHSLLALMDRFNTSSPVIGQWKPRPAYVSR